MKEYHIKRAGIERGCGDVTVLVKNGEDKEYPLLPAHSQSVRNHSPDGFEFGYAGSGPAQLALAIMLDFTEDDRKLSQRWYQEFKFDFLAGMHHPGRVIKADEIRRWLDKKEER